MYTLFITLDKHGVKNQVRARYSSKSFLDIQKLAQMIIDSWKTLDDQDFDCDPYCTVSLIPLNAGSVERETRYSGRYSGALLISRSLRSAWQLVIIDEDAAPKVSRQQGRGFFMASPTDTLG